MAATSIEKTHNYNYLLVSYMKEEVNNHQKILKIYINKKIFSIKK
jgi:hypothetical protein